MDNRDNHNDNDDHMTGTERGAPSGRPMAIILLLLFAHLVAGTGTARAQIEEVYSMRELNGLLFNPAFAGSHVQLSATAMYRRQWDNFPGAPQVSTVTAHTSLFKERIGVGIMMSAEDIGSYDNTSLFGMYSYRIKMAAGTLSMGLQAGFNNVRADYSELNLNDLNGEDPAFVNFSRLRPNFGAGLYFDNRRMYVGVAVPSLLNNSLINDVRTVVTGIRERRSYFLHGGLILDLDRLDRFKFNPSLLVRAQEGQPLTVQASAAFIINENVKVGASFRSGDSFFIPFFALKLSDGFNFAYSYDNTASDLRFFSNNSHEFMLNYRTIVKVWHGNPECPKFYQY